MKTKFYVFITVVLCGMFLACTSGTEVKESFLVKVDQQSGDGGTDKTYTREVDGDSLTLTISNLDANSEYQTRLTLINTFFDVYPKIRADFNAEATSDMTLVIDPTYDGTIKTEGNTITVSGSYMLENPFDTDILTAELIKVVVAAPEGSAPDWLMSGIGNYLRYKYGLNNDLAGWELPEYSDDQYYTDGGKALGRFFVWFELNWGYDKIQELVKDIQMGTYTSDSWIALTKDSDATADGLDIDGLWELYTDKNNILVPIGQPIDWTEEATLTVSYENANGVDASEGSPKLIDNNTSTKFLIFNYPEAAAQEDGFWMTQKFKAAREINTYTLTSANDASGRDPKNWTIEGSNDNSTWTLLDTQTNQSFSGRGVTNTYTFDTNGETYQYYRFTVTANGGDTLFQLAEWRLIYIE
ncbi:discoidin domain-containing protein [Zhouia sp. PK063]|uniref:discoidin domain-containing protein n=1 Tax=Zhouia sp. PK063 TaxID=3373602 RepID=UPI0037A8C5D0